MLQLRHLDDALERIVRSFSKLLDEQKSAGIEQSYDFDAPFRKALAAAEQKLEMAKETKAYEGAAKKPQKQPDQSVSDTESTSEEDSSSTRQEAQSNGAPLTKEEIKKRILAKKKGGSKKASSSAAVSASPTKEKTARKWASGSDVKLSKEEKNALSKSKAGADEVNEADRGTGRVNVYNLDAAIGDDESESEEYEEEEEEDRKDATDKSGKRGFFGNLVRGLTGRTLDREDLEPVLAELQDHLVKKNVASDVAAQLCTSVQSSLLGKQLGSLSSVSKLVREALRVALVKILTPKRHIDILVDVDKANKGEGRPYTIVFVGINGVGKSTNLAKVCSWLLSNQKKVLIAACDTFRSGAVEQLAVHCRALDVPLFQQGYGNDAATIAQFAVREAAKNEQDVVLIDTAGRMQDNERLMMALAKLVQVNRPDLIIFVGEALAGNDAVDQLTKFNQALSDFSGSEHPRQVDGIILSKFDTVDDQVGTAVSLSYSSGLPIVFCGTGQHYGDLRKLHVDTICKSLLK